MRVLAPQSCPTKAFKNALHVRFKATVNKKNPANAKGDAQQRCMFESPVKQNQSPEGARRPATIYL